MARPTKAGLEYFSLDVRNDDKLDLIEAEYGISGFGIVIQLYRKIYENGYYYKWGDDEKLLFCKRINVDIKLINDVINACLKRELFDPKLFQKYNILTSSGIQKRYLKAVERRKSVEFIEKYLSDRVNEYINEVNVNINWINDDIGTQSKVKESKVKESKELSSEILAHWNKQKIILHKKIDSITYRKIFRTCEDYHINNIIKSISNYAEIVHSTDYFFNYKWTLKDFLQRGMDKFMDLEVAKSNYKNKPIENKKSRRQGVQLTKEQKEVYR